jgi:hypothetical protein
VDHHLIERMTEINAAESIEQATKDIIAHLKPNDPFTVQKISAIFALQMALRTARTFGSNPDLTERLRVKTFNHLNIPVEGDLATECWELALQLAEKESK